VATEIGPNILDEHLRVKPASSARRSEHLTEAILPSASPVNSDQVSPLSPYPYPSQQLPADEASTPDWSYFLPRLAFIVVIGLFLGLVVGTLTVVATLGQILNPFRQGW
jgi:hypothetical protein